MAKRILMACLLVGLSGAANATLIDRGSGMIYDDVLDITWLSDANLGGSMNWDDSVAWADTLIFGGFDDWRLASMDVNMDNMIVDCFSVSEAACQDNELGYMFYQNMVTFADPGLLFTNVQFEHWSGTEFAPNPNRAWLFDFLNGDLFDSDKVNVYGAWAVRSGDVLAAPEPGMIVLLGLGLAGLGFARRRGRSGLR